LGQKINSEAVNDALIVHGFSIGCKAEFTCLTHFSWPGHFLLCRDDDMDIGVQGEHHIEGNQHTVCCVLMSTPFCKAMVTSIIEFEL